MCKKMTIERLFMAQSYGGNKGTPIKPKDSRLRVLWEFYLSWVGASFFEARLLFVFRIPLCGFQDNCLPWLLEFRIDNANLDG